MTQVVPRQVVAIDGLAATGKTAIARLLAEKLGFCCLHTGLLYRAVAYLVLLTKCPQDNVAEIVKTIAGHEIAALDGRKGYGVLIDGTLYSEDLSSSKVGELSSFLAAYPEVRQAIFNLQREAFPGCDLVAEGRDMGTVVFPDAAVKFFVNASAEVRAQRRLAEFIARDPQITAEKGKLLEKELENELNSRDQRDTQRVVAPTVPAPGTIIVDNSSETLTTVVQKMYVSSANLLRLQ